LNRNTAGESSAGEVEELFDHLRHASAAGENSLGTLDGFGVGRAMNEKAGSGLNGAQGVA
jgi:hypothetical protein